MNGPHKIDILKREDLEILAHIQDILRLFDPCARLSLAIINKNTNPHMISITYEAPRMDTGMQRWKEYEAELTLNSCQYPEQPDVVYSATFDIRRGFKLTEEWKFSFHLTSTGWRIASKEFIGRFYGEKHIGPHIPNEHFLSYMKLTDLE